MSGNIIDMGEQFEKKSLQDEIERIMNENTKLRILLKEADCDYDVSDVSDEEALCINQINRLKQSSDGRELSTDEIKNFDLLNKNLKLIRGQLKRGKKTNLGKILTKDLVKQLK